jgi:NitT/TauT family transport system permease protein
MPEFRNLVLPVLSIVVAILIWQFIADFLIKNTFILPSFFAVISAIVRIWDMALVDITISLLHFAIGLSLGIALGVPVGSVMGWFKSAERAIDPIIEIIRPIPPIAWIPFAIIWFHLTHYAAGFVVFIGAFFPILINTYSGFKGVSVTLTEAAKVLGCTKSRDLMKSVAFPSAMPSMATGIRVGMGVGWMSVVAAEMFGVSKAGLGYRLFQEFYQFHQMDSLLLYMVVIGLIALILDRFFRYFVEGKMLAWRVGLFK